MMPMSTGSHRKYFGFAPSDRLPRPDYQPEGLLYRTKYDHKDWEFNWFDFLWYCARSTRHDGRNGDMKQKVSSFREWPIVFSNSRKIPRFHKFPKNTAISSGSTLLTKKTKASAISQFPFWRWNTSHMSSRILLHE